jgi:hypothetical protein
LPTTVVVPERFLYWIANEQAFTAVKVNKLENFETSFIMSIERTNRTLNAL